MDGLYAIIGEILPSAVGVAISPIPIIAVILMLGTPRARQDGPAFAAGWIVGLVAVSLVVSLLSNGVSSDTAYDSTNWLEVALGLVFFGLARREWKSRPAKGEPAEMPTWMKAIDEVQPGKAFTFGVLLSGLNPKNLALTAAASARITQAQLSAAHELISFAVFVIIASITVVGSVVFYLLAGDKAAKPLASLKEVMVEHNVVIMVVILLILGAKLLGDGLAAFP